MDGLRLTEYCVVLIDTVHTVSHSSDLGDFLLLVLSSIVNLVRIGL